MLQATAVNHSLGFLCGLRTQLNAKFNNFLKKLHLQTAKNKQNVFLVFFAISVSDTRLLTWPDPAVQRVKSVSWLVLITAVIPRIISCNYWWHLISLIQS